LNRDFGEQDGDPTNTKCFPTKYMQVIAFKQFKQSIDGALVAEATILSNENSAPCGNAERGLVQPMV
jgi:hypothetical protein